MKTSYSPGTAASCIRNFIDILFEAHLDPDVGPADPRRVWRTA